jgi:hypothetical protein
MAERSGKLELTASTPRHFDHGLFGYADGHRQLASTVRLPPQDMYYLSAASDLASGVKLDPAKSYVTGLPLAESRRFALIRTWAAPEMPRPGCVWSHVLLLDESAMSALADMSIFFTLFQDPRQVVRSFYSQPLSLSRGGNSPTLPNAVRYDMIADIIGAYYSHLPTFLPASAGAEALESAIAAVWSQQWPRLRMEFSFRTAQLGSAPRRNGRYDVQVVIPKIEDNPRSSDWIGAVASDAGGTKVTPLRRFLWRYGRDMERPRDRFRLLVDTFLVSEAADALPLAAANRVFGELPEASEGAILKNDILGFGTNSLSICPAVSFLDMLRVLESVNMAVELSEISRRFGNLSSAAVVEVVDFALSDDRFKQLRDPIIEWTIERADEEIINSVSATSVRIQILMGRPELVSSRSIADLPGEDLFKLFEVSENPEATTKIVDAAVRRDLNGHVQEAFGRAPVIVGKSVIEAALKDELNATWRRPIVAFRDALLGLDPLSFAEGLADVLKIARLTDFERDVFEVGRSSENWAKRWRSLRRDVSQQETLDIESDLLIRALREGSLSSWALIEAVLPELRREINARPLGGDARQKLERSLPSLSYDNWDLNRRIMLALHGLLKRTPIGRRTLSGTGLSDVEIDFVYAGPKEEPKGRVGLFWWLG